MPTKRERIAGGVIGLLVGDALGVPYEFHAPEQLPPKHALDLAPPPDFQRAHDGVPPGTYSDDGAQALCLLASLLHCGRVDLEDLGRRFINWYELGYLSADGNVFDVGIQTRTAIENLRAGAPATEAGRRDERANGNGSLMRVLPLALWHTGSDEALVTDARRQSVVTHGHVRSQLGCALYCLWVRRALEEHVQPWTSAIATMRSLFAEGSEARAELETHYLVEPAPPPGGSGYVVDALLSARWATEQGSYEQAVKAAISLGHDTDTTAAIAGGFAGARDGIEAIPRRWRDALRGRDQYEPLITELIARVG